MTPSLKKLKASRRPTLWYLEDTNTTCIVYNKQDYSYYGNYSNFWFNSPWFTVDVIKFAHKHWEFVSWI